MRLKPERGLKSEFSHYFHLISRFSIRSLLKTQSLMHWYLTWYMIMPCKWLASILLSVWLPFFLLHLGYQRSSENMFVGIALHQEVFGVRSDHSDHGRPLVSAPFLAVASVDVSSSVCISIFIHQTWMFPPNEACIGPSIPDFIRGCNSQLAPPL